MCLVSTNNEEKNMGSKESVQRGLFKNLCKTLFWDWEKLLAAVGVCAAILVYHYTYPNVFVTVQVVSALIPENYF